MSECTIRPGTAVAKLYYRIVFISQHRCTKARASTGFPAPQELIQGKQAWKRGRASQQSISSRGESMPGPSIA